MTGEIEKANQQFELWIHDYPHDDIPHANLGNNYGYLGQYEKAATETREELHAEADVVGLSNLGMYYLALDRLDERRLIYWRDGNLVAQPFDPRHGILSAVPVAIAEHVAFDSLFGFGAFSASADGKLVYVGGEGPTGAQLVWYERTGKVLGTLGGNDQYVSVAISPDGSHIWPPGSRSRTSLRTWPTGPRRTAMPYWGTMKSMRACCMAFALSRRVLGCRLCHERLVRRRRAIGPSHTGCELPG